MAHFAELDENNKVLRVIVVDNAITHDENGIEQESLGVTYCKQLFGENTKWVQTSYNNSFRNVFASKDYTYFPEKDIFLPEQPYPSWVPGDKTWLPPIPELEGEDWEWDEPSLSWKKIIREGV